MEPTREQAWDLLTEYTKNENLRKHGLAVEAAMRYYARQYGEDEERWGITGLIHDFDYERWPNPPDHPAEGAEILAERGWPEDIIQAVKGHADYMDVERKDLMAKVLYAVDELSGFVIAVALVRPSKSIHDVKVKSVTKKFKQKSFAAGVDREQLWRGVEELGVEMKDHVANVIEALKEVDHELGLAGE